MKHHLNKLEELIKKTESKYLLCSGVCRICVRKCNLLLDHQQSCDCCTTHSCKLRCMLTAECVSSSEDRKCIEMFGHQGDHRCSEGNHRCQEKCSIIKCNYMCTKDSNHDEIPDDIVSQDHNCGNKHQCSEPCTADGCTKLCSLKCDDKH